MTGAVLPTPVGNRSPTTMEGIVLYVVIASMDDLTSTSIVEVTEEEFEILKEYEDDLASGSYPTEITSLLTKLYKRSEAIPKENRIVIASV